MLKKVLLMSMALLVGINTVNACEVEHKGANNKGEIITDFKPCMQDSCPIYKKYRELEIIIEIELQEKMSDEQVATNGYDRRHRYSLQVVRYSVLRQDRYHYGR